LYLWAYKSLPFSFSRILFAIQLCRLLECMRVTFLLKYCEAALANRTGETKQLRTRVENAISSVLPHGRVLVGDIARNLGMSRRTLERKLAEEGLNFTEVLQQLRRDLAARYLRDRNLHVSKIAWLLGFHEVSAFTHAFKRWTGETPSQMRTSGAY
jgi:AraC-like DNA-binding protein